MGTTRNDFVTYGPPAADLRTSGAAERSNRPAPHRIPRLAENRILRHHHRHVIGADRLSQTAPRPLLRQHYYHQASASGRFRSGGPLPGGPLPGEKILPADWFFD